jgi:hypothetical protein
MKKIIGLIGLLLVGGFGVVLLAKSPKILFDNSDELASKPPEVTPPPIRDTDRITREVVGIGRPVENRPIKNVQIPNTSSITPSIVDTLKNYQQPAPSKITPSIVDTLKNYQQPEPPMTVRPAVIPQPVKSVTEPPMTVRPAVIPQPAKSVTEPPMTVRPAPIKGFAVTEPMKVTTVRPMENPKFHSPLSSKAKDFSMTVQPKGSTSKFKG